MKADIYTRMAVNKLANVVVNQCNCEDVYQLNDLVEQRDIMRANASKWMQESRFSKGLRKKNRSLITQANKDLQKLNKQLRAYDVWRTESKPKDINDAFKIAVITALGYESYKFLMTEAKKLSEVWDD